MDVYLSAHPGKDQGKHIDQGESTVGQEFLLLFCFFVLFYYYSPPSACKEIQNVVIQEVLMLSTCMSNRKRSENYFTLG